MKPDWDWWTGSKHYQALLSQNERLHELLVAENAKLRTLLAFREAIAGLPPLQVGQVDDVVLRLLAATSADSDWWVVLHRLLDAQQKVELQAALGPGLSDEERHYCAGRAAALGDFGEMLLKSWARLGEG